MSHQHDYNIANAIFSSTRADINAVLLAIAMQNEGTADPATTFAYQRHARTDIGIIYRRNAANSAGILDGTLAETLVQARTSNTILGMADHLTAIIASGTWTQTLDAVANLADGWRVAIRNNGNGVITIDPNGSETIDGVTTLALQPGQSCVIICNGSAFYTVGLNLTERILKQFWAHQSDTPDMNVQVEAGGILLSSGFVTHAAQTAGPITAPTTNPRIDRIVLDQATAAVSVVAGTEAASPSAPAVPSGKIPLAQVALTVGQTSILNSDITWEMPPLWTGLTASGWQDVKASRAFSTVYENTGTKPRQVSVTVNMGGGDVLALLVSPDGSTGWVTVAQQQMGGYAGFHLGVYGEIDPGYFYKVNITTPADTIDIWAEK